MSMMKERFSHFKDGKKILRSVPKKGTAMGICATFNPKYLCCNVHVIRTVQNCPFECSYCFLQNYLTDGTTKSVSDITAVMEEVRSRTESQQDRLFRIGSWELGDSLALEQKTGQARRLVQEFATLGNAVLELKTKSSSVEPLLNLRHNGRTVVSWSLNTRYIIDAEEQGTAPLQRRLEAIKKVADAGYPVGLHFDPMILHDAWQERYADLIHRVSQVIPAERVAWISIGSLRFNPGMKKKIENNYPQSRLTCAEMVSGDDAKVRYVKPVRIEMYRLILHEIHRYLRGDMPVYLCMERPDMWENIFGHCPGSVYELDFLFAKSLYERFGMGETKPGRADYEDE